MGLPGEAIDGRLTASEPALLDALRSLIMERSAQRPEARHWYPLSRVTYDLDEIAAAVDALCSFETTMGRRVEAFEQRFAQLHGAEHAVMVNSGSSADLIGALLLVDPEVGTLAPGDEVLVPAVTWPTQIDSLLMAGLSVRLVDVDPTTLSVDLDDLQAKVGPRTRAVSAVHLMGNPCDMDRLLAICEQHELVLFEDCCEALGARWGDQAVGTFGAAAAFSFFFSHHITTMEGGMVLCRDAATADAARLLRAHGWSRNARHRQFEQPSDIDRRYTFLTWGLNVRPTELQGAFGLVQLDRLEGFQQHRRANAERFAKSIAHLDDRCRLMQVQPKAECSWFALPMLLAPELRSERARILSDLEAAGVETRPIVAGNLARQPMTRLFPQIATGDLPGADEVHERGFYLGLHPLADDDALDRLATTVAAAVDARAQD